MEFQTRNGLEYAPGLLESAWRYRANDAQYSGSSGSFLDDYLPFPSAVTEPPADVVDRILFDKRDILHHKMKAFAEQMEARKRLYENNMEQMDEQECGIDSKIMVLDDWSRFNPFEQSALRRKQSLEQELHQLHKERRTEKQKIWEDMQAVYKDLLDVVEQYRSVQRNESILGDDPWMR